MKRRLKEPFGKAGLTVAVVALVFAMLGGAYAANGGSGDGNATASAKAKKGPRGPKGAKGDTGPAGPAGPAGPQGAKGDTGAAGSNGSNGSNGASGKDGVSPTGTSFTGAKGGCTEGGVEFKGANTTFACNGMKGANGQTGFTKTLPPGETETGAWGLGPYSKTTIIPISFSIPLAVASEGVHFVKLDEKEYTAEGGGVTPVNCLGSAEDPTAQPGHVCFYEGFNFEEAAGWTGNEFFTQSFTSGATMYYNISEGQAAYGTWAVTAAEP